MDIRYSTSKNCGSAIIEFGVKKSIKSVNLTRNCINKTAKDVDGVSDQIFLAGEYGMYVYVYVTGPIEKYKESKKFKLKVSD